MYKLLLVYNDREGNCNVPHGHKEYGKNRLGVWLDTQRISKKKGTLYVERINRLEKIGVVWNVLSKQWDDMYTVLVKYKEREGNCNVPHRHKGDGGNLGLWLNRQRIKKKNGTLDAECIHRLEKIGVVWDVLSKQWDDMYTLLVKYKEREGNCNVPKGHEEDGENLGNWLRKQRANKKKGTLVDAECIRRLEKTGVVWDVFSQQWDDMYTLLVEYKAREGNCNVPRGHEEDGESLGRWFNTQRIQMKTGKLVDVERIRRLEELGIIWKLR
ncbi:hypothetical protein FRACYDRAFT_184046 [Fragilariopsis cylindrus CCMP1102]|uniref:Helicase-associated domain-containing protein n=1 Tax=Fragilariopsis cylindrus CCMP1102 TaxID=635003 RepID=A0A1E7FIE9_9STRA|nr:hypothetical protein FRACYDRAFT_184046 [Fragilariopsis cylindrus CCMP1102]|eukprot:OEU17938.1 hypothetical protein FRACYDRAFT_184046 [Fragilariopsis cylindrus CCMP1102]